MDYQEIIKRLKQIRMRKNLSAKDLGKKLGKSYTYFYKVEDGSIILSVPNLLEVLQVLDVSIEEFFHEDFDSYNQDKEIIDVAKSISQTELDALLLLLRKRYKK